MSESVCQISNVQEQDFTVTFLKKDGTFGNVDGVPVFTSDDEGIATVVVSPDVVNNITVRSAGVPGETFINCSVDTDLGAGVTNLTGRLRVVVSDAGVMRIEWVAGDVRVRS